MSKAFETHTDYIKTHAIKDGKTATVTAWVEADFNPQTDGVNYTLVSQVQPLSLPVDEFAVDDISLITECLLEAACLDDIVPETLYTLHLVQCSESVGYPHVMVNWAILDVEEKEFEEIAEALENEPNPTTPC